ncbi:MAG: DUF177 domain-containing protein [Anaerosomatales bacterium]|nr:DUF177 domain-containing protein [Anaerosomatales bacterium]MDT8433421.1 DUF177 domain-containing protein [Anaerosomatales bacterium]
MTVDVSPILGEAGATLELDSDVPLESIAVGDTLAVFEVPPRIRVTLAHAGEVLVLTGTVEAAARLECSRCLEPFALVLNGVIDAVVSQIDDTEQRGDDQEWYPLDGEILDLLPAAESALRVEVPFAPVHDEECRGICPMCGCDLNRDSCTCEPVAENRPENPFSSLKDLLPPEDE